MQAGRKPLARIRWAQTNIVVCNRRGMPARVEIRLRKYYAALHYHSKCALMSIDAGVTDTVED